MNHERRNKIAKMLESNPTVTNSEIMERFGVSIETVRRDLSALEKRGVLERVYGGAVKKNFINTEPGYDGREKSNTKEKQAIALAAKKFINVNDTVFFDIGTTVWMIAKNIDESKKITGFTNSLRTAVALAERDFKVFIPGGSLRKGELAVSGSIAEQNMRCFNIDKAFIGVGGISEEGITDFIESEASFRKQIIKNARTVIAVADHSKFSIRAMCNICGAEEIDILITDKKAPGNILKALERNGTKIVIAP